MPYEGCPTRRRPWFPTRQHPGALIVGAPVLYIPVGAPVPYTCGKFNRQDCAYSRSFVLGVIRCPPQIPTQRFRPCGLSNVW